MQLFISLPLPPQASKFFVVFESEITYWEKTLSHISETIEIILQVWVLCFRRSIRIAKYLACNATLVCHP